MKSRMHIMGVWARSNFLFNKDLSDETEHLANYGSMAATDWNIIKWGIYISKYSDSAANKKYT